MRPDAVFRPVIVLAGLLAISIAPTPTQAGSLALPVDSRELDNGLQVHVVQMDSAPGVVAVYTWMAVGSRDEVDEGRTGFAHFFEHLMFFDTETMTTEQRDQRMLEMGVDDNAWTWLDETVYHGVLPARHLEDYLTIEADRFQNLQLTEDDVRKEAGAVYGEYRKSVADPGFVLDATLHRTAFTTHTYGHDTIGYEADIQAMPGAHAYAMAFFERLYRPQNATLLIVGDVSPSAVLDLVDSLYGDWEPGDVQRPEVPVEPEQTETRRADIPWRGPTTPRITMAWKVPGHDATSPDIAHLQLAADLLLSPVGRLQERLIREEGLAYSVWGGRDSFVDPGLLRVDVVARSAEHLQTIEQVIREEVEALQAGPTVEALDTTRTHNRYRFLTSLDRPARVADTLGWMLRRNADVDALDTWMGLLDSATVDDVAAAASKALVDETLTIVTLASDAAATTPEHESEEPDPEPADGEPAPEPEPTEEAP